MNPRAIRFVHKGILWLLTCWISGAAAGEAAVPRSILVFDQSAIGGPFYADIFSALRSTAVRETGPPGVSVFLENLDFSRFGGAAYEKNLEIFLAAKYRDRPIDVIVAIGSATFEYVMRLRKELWSRVPVVFAMVDEPTLARLRPPPNVTGTVAKLRFQDSLNVARAVVPGLRGIAILGDPLENQVVYRHFKEEIPVAASGLDVIDLTGKPMRELKLRVANLPDRTAIIYTAIYSDGEGTFYPPVEALGRVAEAANRPIVISVESFLGRGGIGGYVLSSSAIGETAARQALRALDGDGVSSDPAAPRDVVRPVFDWRQMERWGVQAAALPPGSEVRFRSPSVWDQYRDQVLLAAAAIVIQAALIAGLLLERRRRRRSEASERETMAELAHAHRFATAGELSASIAHEVNQPLTGMIASANAALRWLATPAPDLEKARAALTQIVGAGHRASDVVRGIRAIFKNESATWHPLDMNDLIPAVLALAERNLNKHKINVATTFYADLPAVKGDRAQLQQVLLNLILNAVDSMASVESRPRILRLGSEVNKAGEVLVSVADTGAGIKPDDVDRIFKPLFTTKSRGMGMGLSICRSIVENHNGRIWASSDRSGALIQFSLPPMGQGH